MLEDEFYDGPSTATVAATATRAAAVTTRTVATPVPATHLLVAQEQWTPTVLRDYVLAETVRRGVPLLNRRNPAAEIAICTGFLKRWGDLAVPIARYAFAPNPAGADGFWNSAPIQLTRFTQNSDPYFAQVIAERLAERARTTA